MAGGAWSSARALLSAAAIATRVYYTYVSPPEPHLIIAEKAA